MNLSMADFVQRLLELCEEYLGAEGAVGAEGAAGAADVKPGARLLTKAEVAGRIRKSVRHVERLMRQGKLRKVPNMGRSVRFAPATVEKLISGAEELGRRRL